MNEANDRAANGLRLVTLGGAALHSAGPTRGDATLFGPGKPLALLVYLACTPGRTAHRDQLAELLWSTMEPDAARQAVRQTLWSIGRRVGADLFERNEEHVTLGPEITSDRDELLAASERADIERVVELYCGDFFPGFAAPGGAGFERWADLERARLRAVFIRDAETLVRRWLSEARFRDAHALARRVRDQDQFSESGSRLLLEALIAGSNSAIAAAEAHALEQLFAAEDIELEEATRATIRRAKSASGETANARGSASGEGAQSTLIAELVGREREFSTILQAWERARKGRFAHLHVVAPAGLGKTRLLADVRARLRAGMGRVIRARADLGARDIDYAFASDIAKALADCPGALAVSPQAASTLVALNPILSSTYKGAPDTVGGEEALRRRALAIRELILTLSEEQPVALLLDDLHWSDPLSLRVLDAALAGLERARVLVVSASRPTVELRGISHATELALAPLDAEAVAAFVTSIAPLPLGRLTSELPRALAQATHGSPLLLLETLQLLIERRLLERGSSGWTTMDSGALAEALNEGTAIRRRVASLDETERHVLLLLAVSGVPLSTTTLFAASLISALQLGDVLTALERRGLAARRGLEWTAAHDEHAATVLEVTSPDALRVAAAAIGCAMADEASENQRHLRLAASLLARGDDLSTLARVFERFVRESRLRSDRRPDRLLARDLLGPHATPGLETALVSRLPLLVRARLVSPMRIAAMVTLVVLLPLSVAEAVASLRGPRAPKPNIVLVAKQLSADGAAIELFDIPIDSSHFAAIGTIDVLLTGTPRWRLPGMTFAPLAARPDGRGWAVGKTMKSSDNLDLFEVGLDGTERRLTSTPGDDYQPSWAPDNSALVFTTMQWSKRAHYDLAIYDVRTKVSRQLTSGDDTDWFPDWSPDGARISFARKFSTSGLTTVCVVDVDGSNLRCLPTAPETDLSGPHWTGPHQLLMRRTRGDSHEFLRIDLNTGATDNFGDLGTELVSPDGHWVACLCARQGYPAQTWSLFELDRPGNFKILQPHARPGTTIAFEWAPSSKRLPYVDSVTILSGPGQPTVGTPYQLRAAASDSARRPMEVDALRWRSLDTTVAAIDSAGRLITRRAGRAVIEATVGGWRRTRKEFVVEAPTEKLVFEERWMDAIAPSWVPFGDPLPEIVTDGQLGRALLNHGDATFFSGAYSARSFDSRGGLWLDAEVTSAVTASEWQDHDLQLFSVSDSTTWSRWDRVHGDPPGELRCEIRFPMGIGGRHIGEQLIANNQTLSAPPVMRSGRSFHVLLQIFPDGRCGSAIDGTPLAIGEPMFFAADAHVMIAGNSVGTKMLVGHLRVMSGIAPHVAWNETAASRVH